MDQGNVQLFKPLGSVPQGTQLPPPTSKDDTKESEHVFITHIRATNVVVSGLQRCILTVFYVSVEVNGKLKKTSCRPVSVGKNVVEWDEEIPLPPQQSSTISFKVYASLQSVTVHGKGVLLCQFKTTVRNLVEFNSQLQPIRFLDKDFLSLHSSLQVVIERRSWGLHRPATRLGLTKVNTTDQLAQLTTNGHRTLLRYHQCHNITDLEETIAHFQHARDTCPQDHPVQSSILFNLATVKFVHCQDNDNYAELDVPVTLYRDALQLRTGLHCPGDHCVAALDLCFGILARLEIQRDNTGKKRVPSLLYGLVESYAYRVAWFAFQTAGITVTVSSMRYAMSDADSGGLDDEELIRQTRSELPQLPDGDPRRSTLLAALGVLLSRRFMRKGDFDDINEAILSLENAVQLTPDIHPGKVDSLVVLATLLSSRFTRLGDLADINMSISVFERALRRLRNDDPTKADALNYFGASLCRRFEYLGDLADIDRSISISDLSLSLTPHDHPSRPDRLANLGTSLGRRFERLGHLADMNKCISMQEEAISLTFDGHVDKPNRLNNLGVSLFHRFERFGDLADVNKSIAMQEAALRLAPDSHADKPGWLSNLGMSLLHRFQRLGDFTDINKSISFLEEASRLIPDSHPNKPILMSNLGVSLSERFDRFGHLTDINQSIQVCEAAVRLTSDSHADKPVRLNSLGGALSSRFERLGDLADIHRSILVQEDAVRLTPSDHPEKPGFLCRLASSLSSRYNRLGDLTDLNKCISLEEEALCLTPNGHPSKPSWLFNVGCSLSSRFERLGDLADINKAILIMEEALDITPSDNSSKARELDGLGTALRHRFEHLGDLADTNKSIVLMEEAVRLTPDDHPFKPARLCNLSLSLSCRFDRLGDSVDIQQSISAQEKAIRLTPDDHPDKPALLNNLGSSFMRRFELLTELPDLEQSISLKEEAVHLTPDGDPNKPGRLNNLGLSFLRRFERLGHLTDINRTISIQEEALGLTPNDHPDGLFWLNNLGSAYMLHFGHSHDPSSLSAAMSHFSNAARASIGATYKRFHAVQRWITCARLQNNRRASLDAYTTAIHILPELAWLGLPLAERHRLLSEAADVARDAAATSIEACSPEIAVEWLEQGRSIVWNQFMQLRTPVDELCVEHLDLARQFHEISRELEHATSRENAPLRKSEHDSAPHMVSLEKRVQKHHELAVAREKILTEIRSLPGFHRFLLPKTVEQLASSLRSGPAVYLNASQYRCDALIVMPKSTNVIPVPLPGTSYRDMEVLQSILRLVLEQNRLVISRKDISALFPSKEDPAPSPFLDLLLGDNIGLPADRAVRVKPPQIGEYTSEELFQQILDYLWNNVVNPILDVLGCSTLRSSSGKMTHIFWCPTGPFTFLPIHAAGIYGTDKANQKLSDLAISSYIPNLGSLASSTYGGHSGSSSSSSIRLVVIPQPPTDGLQGLVSVKEEIHSIQALSAKSPFVTIQDSHGTVEDAMEKMKQAEWVHFACHGIQDPRDPLNSGLCLADHRRLKLSDIIRLSRPQGGLAFLSACQTAQGDEKLAEESVHLAAGMLLAGYGGVIATMWAIMDPDAPRVAKDVYEWLFRDGKIPDSTEAAEALHYAVQRLRESGAPFTSWVPFIHVGR